MRRLNKIGVLSFGVFQAIMTGLIGLLFGIVYSFGGLLIDTGVSLGWLSSEAMETPGLSYGTFLAFGALIGMPLIAIVIGFFGGIAEALIYNFIVKMTGGLKIDFRSEK